MLCCGYECFHARAQQLLEGVDVCFSAGDAVRFSEEWLRVGGAVRIWFCFGVGIGVGIACTQVVVEKIVFEYRAGVAAIEEVMLVDS